MVTYRVTIQADKFPTDFTVQASGWRAAIGRAIQEWKKRFKGSHTKELKITAIKNGILLTSFEKD